MPVRTYSSGMLMRLAFAIATIRDPEILLIDEAIGVGDSGFFKKAFARLLQLVERSRILMVASHQDETLRRLCNKAAWLSHGNLIAFGDSLSASLFRRAMRHQIWVKSVRPQPGGELRLDHPKTVIRKMENFVSVHFDRD